jgi:hypothetical protein
MYPMRYMRWILFLYFFRGTADAWREGQANTSVWRLGFGQQDWEERILGDGMDHGKRSMTQAFYLGKEMQCGPEKRDTQIVGQATGRNCGMAGCKSRRRGSIGKSRLSKDGGRVGTDMR